MALPATRRGVAQSEVDWQGKLKRVDEIINERDTEKVLGIFSNIKFIKKGNMVQFFGNLSNLEEGATINIGTLPEGIRPLDFYSVAPVLSHGVPYTPIGSLWIFKSDGSVVLYKPTDVTTVYVSGSFMI